MKTNETQQRLIFSYSGSDQGGYILQLKNEETGVINCYDCLETVYGVQKAIAATTVKRFNIGVQAYQTTRAILYYLSLIMNGDEPETPIIITRKLTDEIMRSDFFYKYEL